MKINIIVKPNAKESKVLGFDSEKKAYIVHAKAAPVDNKANLEVIKVLHKHFKKQARIVHGMSSREKVVELLD